MRSFLLAGAVCALLFLPAHEANAIALGTLTPAMNGVALPNNITGTWSNNNGLTQVTQLDNWYVASLPANTTVRFDFSVTQGTLSLFSKTLSGWGNYDYDTRNYGTHPATGFYYNGGTGAYLTTGTTGTGTSPANSWGGVQSAATGAYTPSALLLATAVVTDPQHAYILFTNALGAAVQINARLQTEIADFLHSGFKASYTMISAVPLPAALPLFGIGLAGLGFIRRRRKAFA